MSEESDFDHEWDIKGSNGMNVTENKLFESMTKIGLNPECQYQISQMTVDFAFPEEKIVIEVNGPYHDTEEQTLRDKRRLFVLHKHGWKRKTFSAKSAYYNPDRIAEQIAEIVGGTYEGYGIKPSSQSHPHNTLSNQIYPVNNRIIETIRHYDFYVYILVTLIITFIITLLFANWSGVDITSEFRTGGFFWVWIVVTLITGLFIFIVVAKILEFFLH